MESIKEVYLSLKEYDEKDRLSLSGEDSVLELMIDEHYTVTAYGDCVEIAYDDKPLTHFHPDDHEEIYQYFYDIMVNGRAVPTKKEIRRGQIILGLTAILSATLVSLGCEYLGITSKIVKFAIWILLFALIGVLRRSNKHGHQNRYF